MVFCRKGCLFGCYNFTANFARLLGWLFCFDDPRNEHRGKAAGVRITAFKTPLSSMYMENEIQRILVMVAEIMAGCHILHLLAIIIFTPQD